MKHYTIFFLLLFLISCKKDGDSFLLNPDVDQDAAVEGQSFNQEFLRLVNEHRTGLGLKELVMHPELNLIVREHSANMASGNVSFGHAGFNTRCHDSRKALGGGNLCAENVAMGQKNPEALFEAWMNSSSHRGNIEQERATHTGFGYFKSGSGAFYWTQIFIEL